jgi:hypothetical protein
MKSPTYLSLHASMTIFPHFSLMREREQEKAGSAQYVHVLTISILEEHAWRSSRVS